MEKYLLEFVKIFRMTDIHPDNLALVRAHSSTITFDTGRRTANVYYELCKFTNAYSITVADTRNLPNCRVGSSYCHEASHNIFDIVKIPHRGERTQ